MRYAQSLRDVLIRKINRAEHELHELKMDYCRFIYGISHRSKVEWRGARYKVKGVVSDSMQRLENGEWSKPKLLGELTGFDEQIPSGSEVEIDSDWEIAKQGE